MIARHLSRTDASNWSNTDGATRVNLCARVLVAYSRMKSLVFVLFMSPFIQTSFQFIVEVLLFPLQALLPGGRREEREAPFVLHPPDLLIVVKHDVGHPLDTQEPKLRQVYYFRIEPGACAVRLEYEICRLTHVATFCVFLTAT